MQSGNFAEQSSELLAVLGYRSERVPPDLSSTVEGFLKSFPADFGRTKTESAFRKAAQSIRVLFQVTDDEIAEASGNPGLPRDGEFQTGNVRSFLFSSVELKGDAYSRGDYATFTREINKRFHAIPTVVLFRTASGSVTLAFVHVRPNKRNPERNVVGNVSLIREINPWQPHRAHVDILSDLSVVERLNWMEVNGQDHNFDGLLNAWLDALDTEELNRRFYRDLFRWFERAVAEAHFPAEGSSPLPAEEHVIRLITRILFVWFIKEKGLIANDLFVEEQVSRLLIDYNADTGDSYYRAVLQNLFFATLNTEIEKRGFVDNAHADRDSSRYRYANEMANSIELVKLFSKTPFINGGLFDCLDGEESTRDSGYVVDSFTDDPAERRGYSVPNRLFFDDDGLITLFNHYKFTVEENTPAEQEVALDPELLGKVFENLLAAFNPETRETVRKQTGSYYTPREVVDYMVGEALVETLVQSVKPVPSDVPWWEDRLRYLLDYHDAFEDAKDLFTEYEVEVIVDAVAILKVLDPAVGSGAFAMGILHKLTLALRRLDPQNIKWSALQKKLAGERARAAFDTANHLERDKELTEISSTFERYRDSDFGRKLYLIQNSIYGVDIQPVAAQIAKLRFFISLAIEQHPTDVRSDNYGIKPLPNLETRFVAADSLLSIDRPTQLTLRTPAVTQLERELNENRERHFHATTRAQKLACRTKDQELRCKLADALRRADFPAAEASKVADWDPYDQNACADWFDSEYMFNVTGGFDIVIGNPPYIQLQADGGKLRKRYECAGFETLSGRGDIYQLFFEKGFRFLKPGGILSFITSNSWLKAEYGKSTRKLISERATVLQLLETGAGVFENVIVDTSILVGHWAKTGEIGKAVDLDRHTDKSFPPNEDLWSSFSPPNDAPWSILSDLEQGVMKKMLDVGTPLKDWDIAINYGIKTGLNAAFIIDNQTKEALIAQDPRSEEIIKPVLRGQDIGRYRANWAGKWLIASHNGYETAPPIEIGDFPAIKAHLDGYFERLERRYDKGRTPYNLARYLCLPRRFLEGETALDGYVAGGQIRILRRRDVL